MSRLKRAVIGHLVVAAHNVRDCGDLSSEERALAEEIVDRAQTLESLSQDISTAPLRGPYDGPGGW